MPTKATCYQKETLKPLKITLQKVQNNIQTQRNEREKKVKHFFYIKQTKQKSKDHTNGPDSEDSKYGPQMPPGMPYDIHQHPDQEMRREDVNFNQNTWHTNHNPFFGIYCRNTLY